MISPKWFVWPCRCRHVQGPQMSSTIPSRRWSFVTARTTALFFHLISLEILCQCEIEVRYVSSDWAHFRSPKNPDSAASSSSYPTFLNDLWGSCRLVTLRSKRRGKLLSKSLPCHIERNGYESRVPVLQAHLHIMINPGCSVEYLHI